MRAFNHRMPARHGGAAADAPGEARQLRAFIHRPARMHTSRRYSTSKTMS